MEMLPDGTVLLHKDVIHEHHRQIIHEHHKDVIHEHHIPVIHQIVQPVGEKEVITEIHKPLEITEHHKEVRHDIDLGVKEHHVAGKSVLHISQEQHEGDRTDK